MNTDVDGVLVAPASLQQEHVWLDQEKGLPSQAYWLPWAYKISGDLDTELLADAVRTTVQRHGSLRTRLVFDGYALWQRCLQEEAVFTEVDLLDSAEPIASVYGHLAEQVRIPRDLGRDAPIRSFLYRLEPKLHVLALIVHHAAVDLRSQDIILRDVFRFYEIGRFELHALANSLVSDVSYLQYALEQREAFANDEFSHGLRHWSQVLDGFKRQPLIRAHLRESLEGLSTDIYEVLLSDAQARAFDAAVLDRRCNVLSVVIAGWTRAVRRIIGVDDDVVGVTTSQRRVERFENTVGDFINTMPVRLKGQRNEDFAETLDAAWSGIVDAVDFGDVPVQELIRVSPGLRASRLGVIYEVIFNSYDGAIANPPCRELHIERLATRDLSARGSAMVYLIRNRSSIRLRVAYHSAQFSRALVETLINSCVEDVEGAFPSAVRAAGSSPDRSMDVGRPFKSASDDPHDVVAAFRAIAVRFETCEAVRVGAASWTYGKLASRAAKIEQELRGCQVAPTLLAIIGARGPEMFAAMFAAWSLNVPVALMEADAGTDKIAQLLSLSGASHVWRCASVCDSGKLVTIDNPETRDGYRWRLLVSQRAGDAPAYVCLTSGSMGRPLAVLGSRRGLSEFVRWQCDEWKIGRGDRFAQLTDPSFDVFFRDVLTPLLSGATLCIPANDLADPIKWFSDAEITHAHVVPSVFATWLSATTCDSLPQLKVLFFAGEPLFGTLVQKIQRQLTDRCEIVNFYGTTESTLATCFFRVPSRYSSDELVPVGNARPSHRVLLRTGGGAVCNTGERGEVFLVSATPSFGYLDGRDSDHSRFAVISDSEQFAISFRTGDVGYFDSDGALRLCGRLDDQIKIAGLRCHPEEIQAHLISHPEVAAAAVLPAGNPVDHLWAAVASDGESDLVPRLRVFLAARIPAPLVPREILVLPALPTTRRGKLDRAKLSALRASRETLGEVVAQSDIVRSITEELWARHFGLAGIADSDEFFSLGGFSLIGIRIAAEMSRRLRVAVTLRDVFDFPVFGEFVRAIEERASLGNTDSLSGVTV